MIALLTFLAALAAPPVSTAPKAAPATPASTQTAAATSKAEPVTQPNWLSGPSESMMLNCTTGYLTDPTFTGELIVMGCLVQPNGSLDQCQVKETKRAQAAGVQDVAICAAAGFRMGPLDKMGKPTAGRPVLIPMGIATIVPEDPKAPSAQVAPPAATAPAPVKRQ